MKMFRNGKLCSEKITTFRNTNNFSNHNMPDYSKNCLNFDPFINNNTRLYFFQNIKFEPFLFLHIFDTTDKVITSNVCYVAGKYETHLLQ